MTPNTYAYPAELLPASWDRNKGTIAKIAGETGIGAALVKLKAKHAAIKWEKLTAMGYGKLRDVAEVDEAEKKAKSYHATDIAQYIVEAKAVRDLAMAVATKFAANKLIPKASTVTAANIAKQADIVAVACKSMKEEAETFAASRDKLAKQIEGQMKLIRPNIEKLKKGLDACIKSPSKQSWSDNVLQNCRSINNGVQVNPEWKKLFGATWIKYDGATFYDTLTDEAKLDEKKKKAQSESIVKMCKEIKGPLKNLDEHFA